MTLAVAAVVRCFLDDVAQPRYGYELMTLTGFPSGKVYPILARLEAAGWLRRERHRVASGAGPARCHYRLDADAVALARQKVAEATALLDGPTPTPRVAPGTS